ncbi:hypothetical protein PI87_18740 [Ralstonia sp. A12]|nr:hypothetical protein PI87_18740 [Ralstonia sp. A12]
MKSIKFVSAIAMAAGILVMGSAQAQVFSGGTITVTGAVSDETCTITGGAGTDSGKGNVSVALDPVGASVLAANKTANHKAFNLIVGGPGQGSCVNGKLARLSFSAGGGSNVDPATGTLLNVAGDNAATNTNVQLTKGTSGTTIDLNNAAEFVESMTPITNNTATINMGAQYFATGTATPTPGAVTTRVQYTAYYN